MKSDCICTLKLGGDEDEDEYAERERERERESKTKMTSKVVGGDWVLELDLRGGKTKHAAFCSDLEFR